MPANLIVGYGLFSKEESKASAAAEEEAEEVTTSAVEAVPFYGDTENDFNFAQLPEAEVGEASNVMPLADNEEMQRERLQVQLMGLREDNDFSDSDSDDGLSQRERVQGIYEAYDALDAIKTELDPLRTKRVTYDMGYSDSWDNEEESRYQFLVERRRVLTRRIAGFESGKSTRKKRCLVS